MAQQQPKASVTVSVSTPHTQAGPTVFYEICSFGDLIVTLPMETSTALFRVSSMNLRIASPVWAKSFDPNSAFFKGTERKHLTHENESFPILELFDDDTAALLAVLRIVHHKHSEVPVNVLLHQLRPFTVVCDKYDCAGAATPIVTQWVAPLLPSALTHAYEDWLFIMCTFGITRNFQALTKKLIENIRLVKQATATMGSKDIYLGDTPLDTSLIPEKLLKDILSQRQQHFSRTINIIKNHLQTLRNAPSVIPGKSETYPTCGGGLFSTRNYDAPLTCAEDCLSLGYGSFIRFLDRKKLNNYVQDLSPGAVDNWPGNLNNLFQELGTTIIPRSEGIQHRGFSCGLAYFESDLKKDILQEKEKIKGLCPDSYMRFKRGFGSWNI